MSLQTGTFKKAYFEITNVCNADCSFCPKNTRDPRFVTLDEFNSVTDKLKGKVEYLYFHLMGEPLLHPDVLDFAYIAKSKGYKVMITTNGLLSEAVGIPLIKTGVVSKISISIHSFEGNKFSFSLEDYVKSCISLADACAENNTVCAFRLWNLGSADHLNDRILNLLRSHYPNDWQEIRSGYKLSEYIFLEYGDRFEWPDLNKDSINDQSLFCHGLRNQIGILSDGTVVPCCLDYD